MGTLARGAALGLAASFLLVMGTRFAAAETPLERGTYLVNSIVACGNCHTTRGPDGAFIDGMELAGGLEIPDEMFTARVPNITPDKETGVGTWTDAQLITAIREGHRPDGTLIGPPMPFSQYRKMSDSDVKAIVTYLRSVPPVKHVVAKSEYRMPLPPAYGPPVGSVPDVSRDDQVAYGAYLAGPLGHCVECHTPMEQGRFDFENRLMAGGLRIPGPWGVSISANITPDKETGIGTWSDADIKRAITHGIRADGAELGPPMPFAFYARMTDQDVNAIVAYLRTLKPVRNDVRQ